MVGGLQNTSPKNDHTKSQQKSQTCWKSMIFGTPDFGETAGVERTFRHSFGFGRLWGSPGGPKTPRDPSKPRFWTIFNDFWSIFGWFLIDFWTIYDQLFAYFFVHFRMWLGRCFAPQHKTQNAERSWHGGGDGPQGSWIRKQKSLELYVICYMFNSETAKPSF